MTDRVDGRRVDAPRRRGILGWLDPRHRHLGEWAFALNRLSGLGVLLYLYLHLVILSLLARGPGSWDAFVDVATHPAILAFDVVLLAGLLIHGFNGVRLTLLGSGLVAGGQKALYLALMVIAGIVLLTGAVRIFEVA